MAREVRTSGRTVYLPDREEWEETPPDLAPRAGPYALTAEVSGFVEHELRWAIAHQQEPGEGAIL